MRAGLGASPGPQGVRTGSGPTPREKSKYAVRMAQPSPPHAQHLASLLNSLNEQLVARHDHAEHTIAALRASLASARAEAASRAASPTAKEQALKSEIAALQQRLRGAKSMLGEQQQLLEDALTAGATRALASALSGLVEQREQGALQRCFQRWVHFDIEPPAATAAAPPPPPPPSVGLSVADELLDELRSQLQAAEEELEAERKTRADAERATRSELERAANALSDAEARERAGWAAAAVADAKAAAARDEAAAATEKVATAEAEAALVAPRRLPDPGSPQRSGSAQRMGSSAGPTSAVASPLRSQPAQSGPSLRPSAIPSPARARRPSADASAREGIAVAADAQQAAPPSERSAPKVADAAQPQVSTAAPSAAAAVAAATASRATEQKYAAVRDVLERVAHGGPRGRGHTQPPALRVHTHAFDNASPLIWPTSDRLGMARKWHGLAPRGAASGQLTSAAMRSASATILMGLSPVR